MDTVKDRLAHHQIQLQYTQTEEELGAEIQRGWGRLFDGRDIVGSVEGSIVPKVPSRWGHAIL